MRSLKMCSRTFIATVIGATRSTLPRRGSWVTQTTSTSRSSSTRSLVSKTSCTAASAICRAPSTSAPFSGLSSESAARAASRTSCSVVTRRSGVAWSRPSGSSSNVAESRSVVSARRAAPSPLPARRAATDTAEEVSSSVTVEVIRSVSSWASSTTSRSCSGSIRRPSKASMAMKLWLVTTTSTSAAAARERST